jgi:hypothetical protein
MNNAICVCTTVDNYGQYIDTWLENKIEGDDKHVIVDVTKKPDFNRGFTFTENQLREKLNFHTEVSKLNWWNSYGNRNIAWFYAHLRMINFYMEHPNYDYYWFFDDDVKMSDWNLFFESFRNEDADFLTYFLFKNVDVDTQPDVPVIDDRTYSRTEWFKRFPGVDANLPTDMTKLFGSFFPTTRFSNRALKTIMDYNAKGFHAYHEGMVPTILNYEGQKMKTIIRPENNSHFFDVNKVNIRHKDQNINWEWI